jgi:hypothetical protein
VPGATRGQARRVVTLETPDKANAALQAELALPLNDASADYPAASVAAYILGDLGTSRLWKRVREQDGLSYSVGAALEASSFEENSPLALSAIFAPQNRERLEKALSEELTRLVRDGATDAEVAEAKNDSSSAGNPAHAAGSQARAGAAGISRPRVRVLGEDRCRDRGGDHGRRERRAPQVRQARRFRLRLRRNVRQVKQAQRPRG